MLCWLNQFSCKLPEDISENIELVNSRSVTVWCLNFIIFPPLLNVMFETVAWSIIIWKSPRVSIPCKSIISFENSIRQC